jgi:formylglycine-generating enzyme required for sulfatase activity
MKRLAALAVLATAAACLDARILPPLGEALVIVDTDAAVPLLVSRLRVDAYTTAGEWYASDDFGLSTPSQWPASFGVYTPDADSGKVVILRLRAYADGNIRDYRGERYLARPPSTNPSADTPLPSPPRGETPRLITQGIDVTPVTEPAPLLTIDRLVLVAVTPGAVESLRVKLAGACFGTMADLSAKKTCVAIENELSPLAVAKLDSDLTLPTKSEQGTFGAAPCTASLRAPGKSANGTPLYDEEVCVPGGAYVFGTNTLPAAGVGTAVPERIALIPPFRMDRYEVTVARWRAAVARGFEAPKTTPQVPIANDGPFPLDPTPDIVFSVEFCTYSTKPLGRETLPVVCLDWDVARDFCQFEGGDLPTEAEWEYVAEMVGRPNKTAFPWGGPDDTDPICAQAVFGRGFDGTNQAGSVGACTPKGFGPLPENASIYAAGRAPHGVIATGDSSLGLGVANLGGNAEELVRDTAYSLGSNCWMSQPLTLPSCLDPSGPNRGSRGTGWDEPAQYTFSGYRFFGPRAQSTTITGFRCVRSATP